MDFSQITEDLFIGTAPKGRDYELLRNLGVRLVIDMRFLRGPLPRRRKPPIESLWLRTIDNPLLPIPILKLMHGVHAALEAMHQGGKVYAHCAYGRHRSVVMGAAILIAQGHSPQEAMALIKQRRSKADPDTFYIRRRILLFARHWAHLRH